MASIEALLESMPQATTWIGVLWFVEVVIRVLVFCLVVRFLWMVPNKLHYICQTLEMQKEGKDKLNAE